MSKVSIIIPSRNEKYLKRTLDDLYAKATGDFEVLVGFNGVTEYPLKGNYPNLTMIYEGENIGLKPMINKLANLANGKYIFKSDAHCSFGESFNEILEMNMEDDWIVTPRFKIIKDDWSIQMRDGEEEFYDYFYLCCPFTDPKGLRFKAGGHWKERTMERLPENFVSEQQVNTISDINETHPYIDETPQMHGSGWFVNRDYFLNELGGFPEDDPDGHAQEPLWLGLRNWLRGGKLMVNKNTWYAHLHQNSNERGYPEDRSHTEKTYNWTADYFLHNSDSKAIHDFSWFLDKFMPMPSWPENWKEIYAEYLRLYP
jgi:glycosyltransferase involved in cell wall biosynthesis